MIELAMILIRDEASIVEARNKVRLLAGDLKFSSMKATRLATITSELCRMVHQKGGGPSVVVGFDRNEEGLGLTLIFQSQKEELDIGKAKLFFDRLSTLPTEDGWQRIEAFDYIPDPAFKPTEEFINTEREKLVRFSRAELLGEVSRKNEELLKLLDDLKKARDELELRVEERTAELAKTNEKLRNEITEHKKTEEKLQATVQELESFAYSIAHDLRTPLVTISGFASALRADIDKKQLDRADRKAVTILAAVSNMEALVEATLQYARAGTVAAVGEKVPFGEIVQGALHQLAGHINSSNTSISLAQGFPTVYVDRVKMVQALTNLIDNCIQYRAEDRPLTIEIGHRASKSEITFYVCDNGTGFDPSYAEKIFELFRRVDKRGSGIGAGLAMTKRIIEAHGGRIWAESERGRGTTIYFTLPQAEDIAAEGEESVLP